MHIKQNTDGNYVVVSTVNYEGDLHQHPSVLFDPNMFIVVDGEPPEEYDILNFQLPENAS